MICILAYWSRHSKSQYQLFLIDTTILKTKNQQVRLHQKENTIKEVKKNIIS